MVYFAIIVHLHRIYGIEIYGNAIRIQEILEQAIDAQ